MQRLDTYCAALLSSRTKAQEAIASGCVKVNGITIYKNAMLVNANDEVVINTQGLLLGRAGYKLRGFINELIRQGLWERDYLKDKRVLDIGSSTGGFTQVLLEEGIKEIICVDVGKNQLHSDIRNDRRVKVFEECDVRNFSDEGSFDLLVCDVSFISLYKLIESFKRIQSRDYIWLFKPQFEVGKDAKRDKKGVLKDKHLGEEYVRAFCEHIQNDFRILHIQQSILKGKEGNEEFFIYGRK
ncbi:TlyA family RNA methyltransferase [Helicobacter mastomyrinus]|uniref:TlyA family RNA methyltransferase n=1 Tax=Helicobacter mastomyrinus TaxID=287948 RepID=A0ABZ3F7D9_9HELI|nr:TlyA family RNA methyltransferase [uncultured Helicobacter sp.]